MMSNTHMTTPLLNEKVSMTQWLTLTSLAFFTFTSGTNQFVVVGLLPIIAEDLQISVTTAGTLVSGYSLASVLGTPLMMVWASRFSKKALMTALIISFLVGNAVSIVAPSYSVLLMARFITAISSGMFFVIATTVASEIVPENKRGTAISILFGGMTISTVLGIPLGTFIGQELGWRYMFVGMLIFSLLAFIMNLVFVPNTQKAKVIKMKTQFQLIKNCRMILALLMTALGFGGTFVSYTYLSLILQEISGFPFTSIGNILLLYGISVAVGNFIGGKIANESTIKSLRYVFLFQAIALAAFSFTSPSKTIGLINLMLIGLVAFMMSSGVQLYSMSIAEKYMLGVKEVAVALNTASFHVGIVIGSLVGGVVIETIGLIHTPWVGAIMVLGAILLSMVNHHLDHRFTNNNSL